MDANTKGGYFGNALQAAAYGGHDKVVEQLINAGADINAQRGEYSTALQAACYGGHHTVLQLLLAYSPSRSTSKELVYITAGAVKAAAGNSGSGKEVMMLLLERRGGDVEITEELVAQVARSFDEEVMMLLLERRGDEVKITDEVVKAAGSVRSCALSHVPRRRTEA